MIVCLCEGVNDRKIKDVIRAGARDVEEIGKVCGAGTRCGACKQTICALLTGPDSTKEVPKAKTNSLAI